MQRYRKIRSISVAFLMLYKDGRSRFKTLSTTSPDSQADKRQSKGDTDVIPHPGLRYAQAEALVSSLLLDKGRMMENIVLRKTKLAYPKKQVFILQFPVGKFDMVVFDPTAASCEIFEIKYSAEAVPQQTRHLTDGQKCADTEHRFGSITGKYVLYRGDGQSVGDIQYRNVKENLKSLEG